MKRRSTYNDENRQNKKKVVIQKQQNGPFYEMNKPCFHNDLHSTFIEPMLKKIETKLEFKDCLIGWLRMKLESFDCKTIQCIYCGDVEITKGNPDADTEEPDDPIYDICKEWVKCSICNTDICYTCSVKYDMICCGNYVINTSPPPSHDAYSDDVDDDCEHTPYYDDDDDGDNNIIYTQPYIDSDETTDNIDQ